MKISGTLKRNFIRAAALANLLLAAMTILAAYGGKVNPATTTIPAIFAMTFPGWVILTMIALGADLFFNRRIALIPFVTLLICLPPLQSFFPLNLSKSVPALDDYDENSFKLMSYNVFDWNEFVQNSDSTKSAPTGGEISEVRTGNPTINLILDEAPEIGCFQECPSIKANKIPGITESQASLFSELFPYSSRTDGEVLFSRFPVTPVKLRQPESRYSWFAAGKVDILGHETLVVSVHLESIGLSNDDKRLYRRITQGAKTNVGKVKRQLLSKLSHAFRVRADEARLLREQIDSLNIGNVIVAGDFNDIPDCYAMRVIAGDDFKNAFSTAGCGPTYTYHANRFLFHIDHVLYRGDMRATDYRCLRKGVSDHYPVEVRFVWE
ncbi:MAG: hypothetical protein HDS68_03560 [Bacteroidales bacterium]|nr:hypothetical protein [Bacteroidales bacterium]